jgi:hypothetical protein
MKIQYLEIVASDVDAVCAAYEAAHGVQPGKVHLQSTSKEMWITGCSNYDFRPNVLQPTAFGGGSTVRPTAEMR